MLNRRVLCLGDPGLGWGSLRDFEGGNSFVGGYPLGMCLEGLLSNSEAPDEVLELP